MEEQRQGRWSTVKIYLDSYIAASFWLHLMCLCLGGTILQNRSYKIRKRKLVSAAFCCAVMDAGAMVMLFYQNGWSVPGVLLGVTLTELMLGAWIAYGRQCVLQNSILLFLITALLAGFFQAVPVRNVGLFCLVGTVLLPLLCGGVASLFRTKQTQSSIYEAKIYQNNEEKCLSAFMDTGNRLRLYGSRVPVVLVDETYLTEWIKVAERTMPQKLVILPYKGVGGKGLLHGVRLRCMLTAENGLRVAGEVAAVAVEHKLFHGCMYQMILQPEVLSMVCVTDTQEGESDVI